MGKLHAGTLFPQQGSERSSRGSSSFMGGGYSRRFSGSSKGGSSRSENSDGESANSTAEEANRLSQLMPLSGPNCFDVLVDSEGNAGTMYIVSGGYKDHAVKAHNLDTLKQKYSSVNDPLLVGISGNAPDDSGHTDLVTCVVIGSDQRTVVTGCKDGTCRVWRVKTGPASVGVGNRASSAKGAVIDLSKKTRQRNSSLLRTSRGNSSASMASLDSDWERDSRSR